MGKWLLVAVAMALPATSAAAPKEDGRIVEVLHNPPGDAPILGPRHAPVTIEFFINIRDYNRSLNVYNKLRKLAARHPRRLRVIFRVVHARSPVSSKAHEAAVEAFAQGRFFRFLTAYYATHRRNDEQLEAICEKAGVDFSAVKEAWEDNRHEDTVVANHYRMRRFGLNAAPGMLVNSVALPAPPNRLDDYEEQYDLAYASAKLLLARGSPLSELYQQIINRRLADRKVPHIRIGGVDGERLPKEVLAHANGFRLKGPIDYSGPHSLGPKNAKAVAVLYCAAVSRNCPTMVRLLSELAAAYPDDFRVVVKPVSLTDEGERRERVLEVHAAAECAAEQGDYWEFFGRVVNQGRGVRDLEAYLTKQAERLGLSVGRWRQCRADPKTRRKLAALRSEALAAGIERTPSLVIGGRIYMGRLKDAELTSLLELELAPGLLGRWFD